MKMEFIGWMLSLAWKAVCIAGGFMLFKYIVRNGKGTINDVLDTVTVFLKTIGHWIRKTCLNYLKRETEENDEGAKVEATVK